MGMRNRFFKCQIETNHCGDESLTQVLIVDAEGKDDKTLAIAAQLEVIEDAEGCFDDSEDYLNQWFSTGELPDPVRFATDYALEANSGDWYELATCGGMVEINALEYAILTAGDVLIITKTANRSAIPALTMSNQGLVLSFSETGQENDDFRVEIRDEGLFVKQPKRISEKVGETPTALFTI